MFGFFQKDDEEIAYVREYNNPKTIFNNTPRDKYVDYGSRERHFSNGKKKDNFEKVCRLIEILDFIFTRWGNKFVLKGGTAINLFYRNMPRMSVDIDLDYIGTIDQTEEEVAADIAIIEQEIDMELSNSDYKLEETYETPKESFISKSYSFRNLKRVKDFIKIEVKYDNRALLMNPVEKGFEQLDYYTTAKVNLMNEYQLYAGKFGAVVRRATARDMFDVYEYIKSPSGLNKDLLHQCLVFDECISGEKRINVLLNPDWKKIEGLNDKLIESQLGYLIKDKSTFDYKSAAKIIKEYLEPFYTLTANEKEFVDKFRNSFYDPTLLFESADMAVRVGWHPGACRLCKNTWVSKEDAITMAKSLEHCGEQKIRGMKARDLFDAARCNNRKGFIFYKLFYGCRVLNTREDDERMLISQLVKASKNIREDTDAVYEVFRCSALRDETKSEAHYIAIIKEESKKISASETRGKGSQINRQNNSYINGKDEYQDKNW
ncbi:MAG: nucleotidyl transferase AbiEii/AbiGii toxin family protein [Clostridia bacterium]|nr:nucleotidyl transferase AbiEii/AbiGii toxin family protein [Clostridia bacterium]